MNDVVKNLRTEAARNAEMQGDRDKHTKPRNLKFRFRNHLFTEAADLIEFLQGELKAAEALSAHQGKIIRDLVEWFGCGPDRRYAAFRSNQALTEQDKQDLLMFGADEKALTENSDEL